MAYVTWHAFPVKFTDGDTSEQGNLATVHGHLRPTVELAQRQRTG